MPSVSNSFDRILKHHVATVGNELTYLFGATEAPGVDTNVDVVVMGLVITNIIGDGSNATTTDDVLVSIGVTSGSQTYYLVKNSKVPDGEAMIVIGWDQKVVLKTGDNIVISTNGAGKNVDVSLSYLKVTTTP